MVLSLVLCYQEELHRAQHSFRKLRMLNETMMTPLVISCNRTRSSRLNNLLDKRVPREDSFERLSSEHLYSRPMCMTAQKKGAEKQSIQNRMVFMNVDRREWILKSAPTFQQSLKMQELKKNGCAPKEISVITAC